MKYPLFVSIIGVIFLMPYTISKVRKYAHWILPGTKTHCCQAMLEGTNVVTDTGKASDIRFTPESMMLCSKCKSIMDPHPLAPAIELEKAILQDENPEIIIPENTILQDPKEFDCIVSKVIDGDTYSVTVDLGFSIWYTARIRLLDVDCPEQSTPEGKQITILVKEMLEGMRATLTSYKNKDKYGRHLCRIKLDDGQDLSELIKKRGWIK